MRLLKPTTHLALLFAVSLLCVAQEKKQEPAAAPAPTGLALAVDTKAGPAWYESVPGSSFGGIYRRLPDKKQSGGITEYHTFKLTSEMEGDAVRVRVFVILDKFHEQEASVGSYLLRENERAVVDGMTKYGYVPMELTVVRVEQLPSALPSVTSRVPSVGVVEVKPLRRNFPAYLLTLRNLSNKEIDYLEIKTYEGERLSNIQWPRDRLGRPLMKSGETYDVSIHGGARGARSQDNYVPSAPQSAEVVTAVFDDGTYEGDAASASHFLAERRGEKMQLARVLELFKGATEGSDARAALEDFRSRVSALERDAPAAAIEQLRAQFPGLAQDEAQALRIFFEGGLNTVRAELLKDARDYAQARDDGRAAPDYAAWMGELRRKYEAWLARL